MIALAVLIGGLAAGDRQSWAQYGLGACFILMLALAVGFPFFAASDYRRLLRTSLFLLAIGVLMIMIFLGFMWMLLDGGAVVVMARVFCPLYGIALCFAAFANYLLSERSYRTYIYSLAREAPYAYYRYRT